MATFSENQVRQLYVINDAADFSVGGSLAEGMYFVMKDANGKPIRSDVITNVISKGSTGASAMARKTKVVKVVLDSNVNSGNPIAGEDYTLRIEYTQFVAQSDEVFYHEFASAHAITGMTAHTLLKNLGENLALNTKKQELVEAGFTGVYGSGSTDVDFKLSAVSVFNTTDTFAVASIVKYNGDYYRTNTQHTGAWNASNFDVITINGILIYEIEQPWTLGVVQETAVQFKVSTGSVTYNGDEVAWGTATDVTTTYGTSIGNGKKMADMEYFYHGNRGDIYRGISFPNIIPTKYMVDASKSYDAIDIHYAYIGANHAVQKSEKTITLIADSSNSHAIFNTATTGVIAKINAVAGANWLANVQ